jgi:protein SCO1
MRSSIFLLCGVLLLGCSGCGGSAKAPSESGVGATRARADAGGEDRVHRVTGVVRKVDRREGELTVFHDPIPGVMGRMEMPFTVRDKSELQEIEVGDEVDAKLVIGRDRSELFDISVTRPALAKPADPPPSRAIAGGQEVPDFVMTTQDGKTLRLSDLRGDVVVLTFIYTRCPMPEFCPLMNRKFKELATRLSLSPERNPPVRLLSISFDPDHDTPAVLERTARLQGAKPPLWTFAVASHDELRKVAEPIGLMYGPTGDQVAHNLLTAVVDARGRLSARFSGGKWTTEELLKQVREAPSE